MNLEHLHLTPRVFLNAVISLAFGVAWTVLLFYVAGWEARFVVSSHQMSAFTSNNNTLTFFMFSGVEAVIFAAFATPLILALHPGRLLLNALSAIAPFVIVTIVNAATLKAGFWSAKTAMVVFYPLLITALLYAAILWISSVKNRRSR